MKKRIFCLCLAMIMVFSIAGCKSNGNSSDTVSWVEVWEEVEVSGEGNSDDKNSSTTSSGGTTQNGNSTGGNNNNVGNNSGGSNNNVGNNSGGSNTTITPNKTGTIEGVNFKGQTFKKTIIGAVSNYVMRKKSAFEKKYNCKIELVNLQWEQYNSQVASAMAAGQPYDICGLQPNFWPEAGIQGLYEPLNKYIYEADLYNPKTGKGIDLESSEDFSLNGHIYGVACHSGNTASMIQVLFYNKLMFEEAGLDDPLELYKKGKWNWDKFFEYGADVLNASKGQYLIGKDFNAITFMLSNGFKYTKTDSKGKVIANTSDPLYLTSLEKYKEFATKYMGPKGYSDDPTEFYNGNYYMFGQNYAYGKLYMYDTIINSSAFDYDFNNLGIVPFPYGPNNKTKANPGHGAQPKAAGKGSKDPRVAVLWAKFDLEFEDPMADEDPYRYSDEINNVILKLFDNINEYLPNYKTASTSVRTLFTNIENTAKTGGDYVKILNDNKNTIQSIIDDALGQK